MFSDWVGKGLSHLLPRGTDLTSPTWKMTENHSTRFEYQHVSLHTLATNSFKLLPSLAKYGKDSFQPIHTPEE
jgi:threonyl-tRNA synthetase